MKDISTALGVVGGFGIVVTANILEGGNPMSMLLLPPMLLVFGTSILVTIAGGTATCQTANSVDAAGNPTSYEPAKAFDSDISTAWRCDGSVCRAPRWASTTCAAASASRSGSPTSCCR